MENAKPSREELGEHYLQQLPYTPYPVQEEALLAWFTSEQGVLVCAPTGTGKTLIAEAALYEALHAGTVAYYTTPLIALTEQKFAEMQAAAVRWGFQAEEVGLVTGNRRVNPQARILVVVAEILLNRLLHPEQFDFSPVSAVVMDEFHNFADIERGIVWELALGLLPRHVRLLLLSATVGNSTEFLAWLDRCHGRKVDLVESTDRRVPLAYQWVGDELLNDQLTLMAAGDRDARRTPALVFCFNRDECWSVAEQLKGCHLLADAERGELLEVVNHYDWTQGVGSKLRQMLQRGVGVHHAGMLPKYRRIVEELYQRKLLAVCVCTETLAAGINLPARSVVLSSLVKGPRGEMKLLDPSTAHQIFGRAGRPQFDVQGYVYVLAHEDDVRILRWKQKYDAIPETTKDPLLLREKKALKKKKPTRRENETYWNEQQFEKLRTAPPAKLYSKGRLPWRLLAYMLKVSPEVSRLRTAVRKRLMDEPRLKAGEEALVQMLVTLHDGGFVALDPPPPTKEEIAAARADAAQAEAARREAERHPERFLFGGAPAAAQTAAAAPSAGPAYSPVLAQPTAALDKLLLFRSVNPLYGCFLLDQLGIADHDERLQAFESVLEIPRSVLKYVRVPFELPAGPLATTRLDAELVRRGLMLAPKSADGEDEEDEEADRFEEEPERPPFLAEKLRLLFDATHPGVQDVNTLAVWGAGELLRLGGNFNNFVKSRDLVKQEGIIFRHLLRLILLLGEFATMPPADGTYESWSADLRDMADRLTASCRAIDPTSTDHMIESAHAADVVDGEAFASTLTKATPIKPPEAFGEGIL